ncbi:segregation and condensation protein A [Lacticaseibacillus songhuajiangensis]|jgi:segregation and condensation protein A|uniref:segregation and condensation protein A n=1 Tax=Lacticaseibacillus songhuajiangensis TaxID=1296539 RepID=UPI000F7AEBB0|nr:segregation/condensation protein A [Lacticaseibacillus songhuajiangensis]MCI1284199.1 segregation/condensation protein A [Lacticaseibacillus songhuajiangensis]
MALTLVLNDFSGPLDLLWHLIKENKIDIYDIPIAKITEQYIAYLHSMQERALDVAGDYFVMAASLMALKSRMLLPEPEPVDEFTEPEDPRADLVAQLLNYQVYQEAAADLRQREQERSQMFAKPAALPPDDVVAPLAPGAVKLRELSAAMQKVLSRIARTEQAVRHIEVETVSLDDKISQIEEQLRTQHRCTFLYLVSQPTVSEVVTTFLALLEMAKNGLILCEQDDSMSELMITQREGAQAS